MRDAHRKEQEELRKIREEEEARRRALEESSRLTQMHPMTPEPVGPMMDVTSLEIPTELALILDSIARGTLEILVSNIMLICSYARVAASTC